MSLHLNLHRTKKLFIGVSDLDDPEPCTSIDEVCDYEGVGLADMYQRSVIML